MLKFLDGLVLLKEIYEIVENSRFHSIREFKENYKKDTIVINRVSYIKKDILPDDLKDKVTDLSEYASINTIANMLDVAKQIFYMRINFMEKNNVEIFRYKKVCGIFFIHLDLELKGLFKRYQPYLITYTSTTIPVTTGKMLGDLKIGFY